MSELQSPEIQSQENHENEMVDQIISHSDINKPEIHLDIATEKLQKGHEIVSEEENKTYFLEFSTNGDKLKILLSEQDIFPGKTFESYTPLKELQSKSQLFSHFSSVKELSEELNKSGINLNFNIKKKNENIITLIMNGSDEENQNIELELKENIIDSREMFRQLFKKFKSIQQEQEEDISQFKSRIKKIEDILSSHVKQQEQGQEEKPEVEEKEVVEPEQKEEPIKKEEINEKQEEKKEEAKLSNKESLSSIQKGKNVKKGKFDKKNEKGKLNKRKIK